MDELEYLIEEMEGLLPLTMNEFDGFDVTNLATAENFDTLVMTVDKYDNAELHAKSIYHDIPCFACSHKRIDKPGIPSWINFVCVCFDPKSLIQTRRSMSWRSP